jgi:hypothetical protein
VLAYLDRVDPEAAKRARYRYSCFDHFGEDSQAYGYAASFAMARTCEDAVVTQLTELVRNAGEYARRDGRVELDEHFFAQQNAQLVRPGLPDSCEALFHDVGLDRFLLCLTGDEALSSTLARPRLQRAIGVIYLPETERLSHYFHTGKSRGGRASRRGRGCENLPACRTALPPRSGRAPLFHLPQPNSRDRQGRREEDHSARHPHDEAADLLIVQRREPADARSREIRGVPDARGKGEEGAEDAGVHRRREDGQYRNAPLCALVPASHDGVPEEGGGDQEGGMLQPVYRYAA